MHNYGTGVCTLIRTSNIGEQKYTPAMINCVHHEYIPGQFGSNRTIRTNSGAKLRGTVVRIPAGYCIIYILLLSFIMFTRPTEDTSDSNLNYLPFCIFQGNRRHFRLEIYFSFICHNQADRNEMNRALGHFCAHTG